MNVVSQVFNVILLVVASVLALAGAPARARADESSVWELQPYRIQVLLVPEWSDQWRLRSLTHIARGIRSRADVEVGRPWQLEIGNAPLALRREVMSVASPEEWSTFERGLAPYRDQDKVVLVFLRTVSAGFAVSAWELDWATQRWSTSREYTASGLPAVAGAAFDAVNAVVSPLALIKLASGRRVVLRQRAELLPLRNVRRSPIAVGSVFHVVSRRAEMTPTNGDLDAATLIVEQTSDQGIQCRVAAPEGNPLENTPLEQWVAIASRVQHRSTRYRLTRLGLANRVPLTLCEITVSELGSDTEKFLGCPNATGEIDVPAADQLQQLKVKVGAVVLARFCIVAGAQAEQTLYVPVTREDVLHASRLAASRDDVAQIIAWRDLYLARAQHRRESDDAKGADALLKELASQLPNRSEKLLEMIGQRRNEVLSLDAQQADRYGAEWAELIETLTGLSKPDDAPQ